jgi:hypothetical protein
MNNRPNPPADPAEVLKAEINKKIRDLVAPANESITEEQSEEISRLNSMLAAYESAREAAPAPAKPRWPVLLVFAVTVLLIAVLLFVRIDHTEISLDLQVSEIEFTLDQEVFLIRGTSVSRLKVDGIEQIQLWPGAPSILSNLDPDADASLLHFTVNAKENEQAIYLDSVKLPAGTAVYVPESFQQGEIEVVFRDASEGLELNATLPMSGVELLDPCETASACLISLRRERPLTMISNPGETYLDLTPLADVEHLFQQEIPIRQLSVRYSTSDEGMAPRKLSTVLGGTIYFEALTNRSHKLRRGEHLELEFDKPATIAELNVTADGLILRVNGVVNKLEVGSQTNLRDMMPRWLVWLQSRHELGLFTGGVTYLFFLILGVFRWWGFNGYQNI